MNIITEIVRRYERIFFCYLSYILYNRMIVKLE
nr:MAG TPA: hypothetical protein [Caudoviricetes sp.]